jgi:hypothetical protein
MDVETVENKRSGWSIDQRLILRSLRTGRAVAGTFPLVSLPKAWPAGVELGRDALFPGIAGVMRLIKI